MCVNAWSRSRTSKAGFARKTQRSEVRGQKNNPTEQVLGCIGLDGFTVAFGLRISFVLGCLGISSFTTPLFSHPTLAFLHPGVFFRRRPNRLTIAFRPFFCLNNRRWELLSARAWERVWQKFRVGYEERENISQISLFGMAIGLDAGHATHTGRRFFAFGRTALSANRESGHAHDADDAFVSDAGRGRDPAGANH